MARIRNPRYAPEFLESRLSPSAAFPAPAHAAPAEVSSPTPPAIAAMTSEEPLPTDANGDPIPPPTQGDGPGQTIPM